MTSPIVPPERPYEGLPMGMVDIGKTMAFLDLARECAILVVAKSQLVGRVVELEGEVEVLQAGYTAVGTQVEELQERVEALEVNQSTAVVLVDRLVEKNKKLEEVAVTDPMTGLSNRRGLEQKYDALTSGIRGAEERRQRGQPRRGDTEHLPSSVLFIDQDGFKRVNDEHGHKVGDELIIRVAQAVRGSVRLEDVVARVGGDEIVVILPRTPIGDARVVAEKLRDAVGSITEIDGRPVSSSVSIGLTEIDPHQPLEEIAVKADTAMYAVKRRGGNAVEVFKDVPSQ